MHRALFILIIYIGKLIKIWNVIRHANWSFVMILFDIHSWVDVYEIFSLGKKKTNVHNANEYELLGASQPSYYRLLKQV